MPLKKQDTNPKKSSISSKESKATKTQYGKENAAELNTDAETTQKQEYKKGGLEKTAKYSVDKD